MLKKNFICAIVVALLSSCASQVAPTGGDKDVKPPQVIRSSPENLSLQFSSTEIHITFDEFIQLNDPANQIFFSPALSGNPKYRLHGKMLSISLPDSLEPNTTYTVNFGSAIKDVNEGNVLPDYQYVFSTGNHIDSLRIEGSVKNSYDAKPVSGILVMLYRNVSDSVVVKERPAYYARTSETGVFRITHLKEGTYKLFALNDQNFDLLYDQQSEAIAFSDSNIVIDDTTGSYSLNLFRPIAEKQKLLSAKSVAPGEVIIVFAKSVSGLQVNASAENLQIHTQFNPARDTGTIWFSDFMSDSMQFFIHDHDFYDTISVRLKKLNEKDKIFPPKLLIQNPFLKNKMAAKQVIDQPVRLGFSTPVVLSNADKKIIIQNDSTKDQTQISFQLSMDSATGKKVVVLHPALKPVTKYTLIIPDSVFTDVLGNYSDSTAIHFTTYDETETGNLLMKIGADSLHHYFSELRMRDGTFIRKDILQHGLNQLSFTQMPPGAYSFSVIRDENENTIWDTGDYWKKIQPEKIFTYPGDVTLRANWDLELEMMINEKGLESKKKTK